MCMFKAKTGNEFPFLPLMLVCHIGVVSRTRPFMYLRVIVNHSVSPEFQAYRVITQHVKISGHNRRGLPRPAISDDSIIGIQIFKSVVLKIQIFQYWPNDIRQCQAANTYLWRSQQKGSSIAFRSRSRRSRHKRCSHHAIS